MKTDMSNLTPMDPIVSSAPRGLGQRVAFGSAVLFYLCAVLCLAGLFLWVGELGGEHPVIASLGASVVFFIGGGIVLHVIGRANLPHLSFSSAEEGSMTPRDSGP